MGPDKPPRKAKSTSTNDSRKNLLGNRETVHLLTKAVAKAAKDKKIFVAAEEKWEHFVSDIMGLAKDGNTTPEKLIQYCTRRYGEDATDQQMECEQDATQEPGAEQAASNSSDNESEAGSEYAAESKAKISSPSRPRRNGNAFSNRRVAVRRHLRNLLFPGINKYQSVPWANLPHLLRDKRKRLINWPNMAQLNGVGYDLNRATGEELGGFLAVQIEDWKKG